MVWRRPNLAGKLVGVIFLLSLAAVGLVGFVIYSRSSTVLRSMIVERLTATADLKLVELENWVHTSRGNVESFARLDAMRVNLDKLREELDKPHSTIWSSAFSPDGGKLATGGVEQRVHVWDLDSGREERVLPHQNTVNLIRFLEPQFLLTRDYENIMRIWDLESGRVLSAVPLAHILDISGSGLLVLSTWNRKVLVWRIADLVAARGNTPPALVEMPGSASWVALSPDGRLLAVSDGKSMSRLYRLDMGAEAVASEVFQLKGGEVGLGFSPDGSWLAAAGKDGELFVYDLRGAREQPRLASTLAIPAGDEREMAFSPDSRWLGSRYDGTAHFDLARLQQVEGRAVWEKVLELEQVDGFVFTPSDHGAVRLVTALEDVDAVVWELDRLDDKERPQRHEFRTEDVGGAGLGASLDGKCVCIPTWTGRVQVYAVDDLLSNGTPPNLAPGGMRHAPLPLALITDMLRSQVRSRPDWLAAALADVHGRVLTWEGMSPRQWEDIASSAKVEKALESGGTVFLPPRTEKRGERPMILLAAPMVSGEGIRLGALLCRIGYTGVETIVSKHTGVGESGELYLLDSGGLLCGSRQHPGDVAAYGEPEKFASILRSGSTGEGAYVNFTGSRVIGATQRLSSPPWTLVAEIPVEEALAPARRLAWTAFAVGGGLILALLGASLFLSRRIALPIMAAADMAQRIVSGHLDPAEKGLEGDEARILSEAFQRMLPALEERVRMLQALDIAHEVQANLLPQHPPQCPGLDIAGRCIYCEETGGDYFDYLDTCWPEGRGVGIVVGDVTGHGVPAALLMTSLRAFLRQRSTLMDLQANVVRDVNSQIARDVSLSGRFATLFLLDVYRPGLKMRWVRAGHDPALVYDPETGEFSQLEGGGLPLGVLEDADFEERSMDVRPGQVVVIATDGVWETEDHSGEMYGKERLQRTIAENAGRTADEILRAVVESVRRHAGRGGESLPHQDDLTLVVLKIEEFELSAGSTPGNGT